MYTRATLILAEPHAFKRVPPHFGHFKVSEKGLRTPNVGEMKGMHMTSAKIWLYKNEFLAEFFYRCRQKLAMKSSLK